MISYLVSIAMMEIGLEQARDLARDTGTPAGELKKLSTALADLSPFAPGLIRAFKGEYLMSANVIDQFRDGKIGMDDIVGRTRGKWTPEFLFHPNKTKLAFANLYRQAIANAPRAYHEISKYNDEDNLGLKQHGVLSMVQSNSVGQVFYALLAAKLDMLLQAKCRAECGTDATRILTAIALYRIEHGNLPPSLESLVPNYLPKVPLDPFDGKPFRYVPSKAIVYSVGSDLKDSGGSSYVEDADPEYSEQDLRWEAKDAVYRILEQAKPKK